LLASAARLSSTQCDFHAFVLTWSRLGVYVIFAVIVDWTGVELRIAIIGNGASVDRKAVGWASTNIALELGGRRSKDATTTTAISEATISIEAIASSCMAATYTILTIGQLPESS